MKYLRSLGGRGWHAPAIISGSCLIDDVVSCRLPCLPRDSCCSSVALRPDVEELGINIMVVCCYSQQMSDITRQEDISSIFILVMFSTIRA